VTADVGEDMEKEEHSSIVGGESLWKSVLRFLRKLDISLGAFWPFYNPQVRMFSFLVGLFGSLESNFLSCLYILDISPVSDVG